MPDDEDQRGLEIVKLRLDFLKHVATLSGAATVIVLAVAQRTEMPVKVVMLAVVAAMFGLAAIISVLGIVLVMNQPVEKRETSGAGSIATQLLTHTHLPIG